MAGREQAPAAACLKLASRRHRHRRLELCAVLVIAQIAGQVEAQLVLCAAVPGLLAAALDSVLELVGGAGHPELIGLQRICRV